MVHMLVIERLVYERASGGNVQSLPLDYSQSNTFFMLLRCSRREKDCVAYREIILSTAVSSRRNKQRPWPSPLPQRCCSSYRVPPPPAVRDFSLRKRALLELV